MKGFIADTFKLVPDSAELGICFKVWDRKNKAYLGNPWEGYFYFFCTQEEAEDHRDEQFEDGMYPDDSAAILEIHKFSDNVFLAAV